MCFQALFALLGQVFDQQPAQPRGSTHNLVPGLKNSQSQAILTDLVECDGRGKLETPRKRFASRLIVGLEGAQLVVEGIEHAFVEGVDVLGLASSQSVPPPNRLQHLLWYNFRGPDISLSLDDGAQFAEPRQSLSSADVA